MKSKAKLLVVLAVIVSLVLAACAGAQPAPTLVPPTPTPIPPTATLTPAPPTPTPKPISKPLPGSVAEVIEVTFDGNECTVSGPTEVPTGEHSFVLFDLSGQNQDLWLARLHDGKTFRDLLDLQPEPGEYYPKPSWAVHPPKSTIGLNKKTGGKDMVFDLDEAGEYSMAVGGYNPRSLWLCAPLWVVEAPSE
jgi:hypothetical protein